MIGLLLMMGPQLLHAGSGQRIFLPVRSSDAIHGVRLDIDTRWVDGNGYRPVRVRLVTEPAIPSLQSRTFQVTLTPVIPRGPGVGRGRSMSPVVSRWASVAVTEMVFLEEGELSGEVTMLIPQSSTWSALRIAVHEDGQLLRECSDLEGYGLELAREEWTEVAPSVLIVSRHAPKFSERPSRWYEELEGAETPEESTGFLPHFSELANQFDWEQLGLPVPVTSGPGNDGDLGRLAEQLAKYEIVSPEDIPNRWIGLSCLDFIFIDWQDVRQLAADAPDKWNAIRTWVESGQTLFVHGIDDEFAELTELDGLLAVGGAQAASLPRPRGWVEPQESDWVSIPARLIGSFRLGDVPALGVTEEGSLTVRFLDQLSPNYALGSGVLSRSVRIGSDEVRQRSSGFRLHEVGLGRVVAVTGSDPFLPRERLAWMVNSLESKRWSWGLRHGFSLRRDNPDLRPFQVPGVGEPPRVTFLLLITLFALVIGPLNYWALRRIRRLHLLLVTVPLAACLVTVLLLGLMVIRDGFQPRVHARSLTWLDQREGRGVTWSTRAYFSSLPPADGLRFSDRSLVYPLDVQLQPHPGMPADRSPSLRLLWQGDQQLRGSYLRPRRTQHFGVISAGSQSNRLVLEPRPGGWQVTNELGAKLDFLLLRAARDEYYYTPSLEVGETQLVALRGDADTRGHLLRLFQDFDPPISSGSRMSPTHFMATIDATVNEPRLTTGIMETLLNEIRTQPERVLAPGHYLAVVDWPDWMDLGVVEPRREPSLHVILGKFE